MSLWSISRILKQLVPLIFARESCWRPLLSGIIPSALMGDSFLYPQEAALRRPEAGARGHGSAPFPTAGESFRTP